MNEKMFNQLLEKPKSTIRWLLLPLSLMFHGVLIAVVILAPFLNADNRLPEVNYQVQLVAFTPPPPKPPAVTRGNNRPKPRNENRIKKKPKPRPVNHRLIPPTEIPTEIEEEEIEDLIGSGEGFGPSIEGAVGVGDGIDISNILTDDDMSSGGGGAAPIAVVRIPKLIRRIAPLYPRVAIQAHIEGVVMVRAVTDIFGRVKSTSIISGHPLLIQAAKKAVQQWIYEPYILNGIPKPVTFTAKVHFQLNK